MKTLKNSVWLGCVGWFYSLLVGASPLENHSNEQLLTNFALASCIATFYPKTEVAKDARVAMQGYVEFSDLSIEVFAGIIFYEHLLKIVVLRFDEIQSAIALFSAGNPAQRFRPKYRAPLLMSMAAVRPDLLPA